VRLIRFSRRLLRNTEGQVLLFAAVLVVAIMAFLLVIPNGTHVATQKVRTQTAADIGAFSGSVWLARALNLNANLNVGLKSVYTWATVLTMGSALAQALYTDSLDPDVRQMGLDLVAALFGTSSTPSAVSMNEYPAAVQSLDATAHWLASLQDDIAVSFHEVAAALGTAEACLNLGVGSPSPTAGGWVLVRSNDTLDTMPLLVGDSLGDALMYGDLREIADRLESLPSGNINIGPAVGTIVINPDSFDIWAYYGFESNWYDVEQYFHYYMFWIMHVFRDKATGVVDTQYAFMPKPGDAPWNNFKNAQTFPNPRLPQDSWAPWSPYSMGRQRDSFSYYLLKSWPGGNNKYKLDTCLWVGMRVPKWQPIGDWLDGDSLLPHDPDWEWDSTKFYSHFYSGSESTVVHTFRKVSPRRPNPDREYHSVSYVWRQGSATSPHGLGAPLGGTLFPRSAVAAPSPLFTLARSVPYMAVPGATEYNYYFTPGWDVRLTPIDSVGVLEITGDTAYAARTRGSFDHLEDLRKYVLLP